MPMKTVMKTTLLSFAAMALFLMSACANVPQSNGAVAGATNAQSGSSQTTNTLFQATPAPTGGRTASITVPLQRSPQGTLSLAWIKALKTLTVRLTVTGLAPNSSHPILAYTGSCTQQSRQALPYRFNPLQANALGDGSLLEGFEHVQSLPTSGQWSLVIYNGPHGPGVRGTDREQAMPIACVTVTTTRDRGGNQFASFPLVGPTVDGRPVPDQNVSGKATIFFTIDGFPRTHNGSIPISITKVIISQVRGLARNSTHVAHIHAGSCQQQGQMLVPLQSVVDHNGIGSSTTVLSSPLKTTSTSLLYINIHETATPLGLQVQQGFDPIACGNLQAH